LETGRENISGLIKNEAVRLGFSACGISRARFLEEEAANYEQWLRLGYHGEMHYMKNNI
jgi:epoxyqueuosine reductase